MIKNIFLNEEDLRWLLTGCSIELRNFDSGLKKDLKNLLDIYEKPVEVGLDQIGTNFGTIARLYKTGLFKKPGDIGHYFKYLGDCSREVFQKENLSHNVMLYRKLENELEPNAIVHNEICAVKPIDLRKNLIWGFGKVYENLILDKHYFGEEIKGDYAITHGRSNTGIVLIESITKDEFLKYTNWFNNVQKRDDNCFVDRDLEKRISQELK
jgi:hypothetical protein